MASFNRVILMGNLTRDPQVRYIPSGTAVADLSLAVSENFKNKAGEQVESTCFVDVVVWARQAETCGQYLSKGSPALVEGSLQLDKWTTKEGDNRSKLRVRASRVQFIGSPKNSEFRDSPDRGNAPSAPAPAAPAPARQDDPPPEEPLRDSEPGDEDNLPF